MSHNRHARREGAIKGVTSSFGHTLLNVVSQHHTELKGMSEEAKVQLVVKLGQKVYQELAVAVQAMRSRMQLPRFGKLLSDTLRQQSRQWDKEVRSVFRALKAHLSELETLVFEPALSVARV